MSNKDYVLILQNGGTYFYRIKQEGKSIKLIETSAELDDQRLVFIAEDDNNCVSIKGLEDEIVLDYSEVEELYTLLGEVLRLGNSKLKFTRLKEIK